MSNFNTINMPRQVWAHYHPFYGTPDGAARKWLTWDEPLRLASGYGVPEFQPPNEVAKLLRHNPDDMLAPGRRSNYSVYYPTLGLYDSRDKTVLLQHAKWAAQDSIDAFIWDYMLVGGNNEDKNKPIIDTIYDQSFRMMLDVLIENDLPLNLAIMYDSYCWFGYPVERIADELAYLAHSYFNHPKVVHFDGRIVVYLYSALAKHSAEDWNKVCRILEQKGARKKLFLTAGEVFIYDENFNYPGLFDGFCLYNYGMDNWNPEGVKECSAHLKRLCECNHVNYWSAAVGPGFDGRIWHHPGRAVARGLGKLYESMWEQAVQEGAPVITICSFNEWGEGTQIEPCLEYEDLYLKLTKKWADIFKHGERLI